MERRARQRSGGLRSGALRMYAAVNSRQTRPITECVALYCSISCLICTIMLHVHFIAPAGTDSCLGAYLREQTDLNTTDVLRITVESEFTRFMDEFERRYNATYEREHRRAVGDKRDAERIRQHSTENGVQARAEGAERHGLDAGAAATGPVAPSKQASSAAGTVPIQMRAEYRRLSPVGRAILDALSPAASNAAEAASPQSSETGTHSEAAASPGGAYPDQGPAPPAPEGADQPGEGAEGGASAAPEPEAAGPAAASGEQPGPEADAPQDVLTEKEEEEVREMAIMLAVQEATEAMPMTEAIMLGDVPDDEVYYYSRHRGFLELPRRLWASHNVAVQNVLVPGNLSCFGPNAVKTVIELSLGFEAPVLNALGDLTGGRGFVHRKGSGESIALAAAAPGHSAADSAIDRLAHRAGVLLAAVFLLVALSTVVSFLMQQLQVRAIRLMLAARTQARRRRPLAAVALSHLFESTLLFVPVFFGIITFLFEFFADQGLTLATFTLVWVGQAFHALCLGTVTGRRWFSRLLCVYLVAFLAYSFTFPFGFTYPATLTAFALTLHAAMVALNRCELPQWEAENSARPANAAPAAEPAQGTAQPPERGGETARAAPAATTPPEATEEDGGGGEEGEGGGMGSMGSDSSSDGGISPGLGGDSPQAEATDREASRPSEAAAQAESQQAESAASAVRDTGDGSHARPGQEGHSDGAATGAASPGASPRLVSSPLGGDIPFSVFRRRMVGARRGGASPTAAEQDPDPTRSHTGQGPFASVEEVDYPTAEFGRL